MCVCVCVYAARCYIHFGTNTQSKGMNLLILQAMG